MKKFNKMPSVWLKKTESTPPEIITRLVCHTPIANDHILHALEARYGEIVAWWIAERLPKTNRGQ